MIGNYINFLSARAGGMSYNTLGVSEVPSEARNLDGALAKRDTHLLADPKGEQRSCEDSARRRRS